MKDGNIIAIIITAHMLRNDAAPLDQDCPGIRIHTIDMVQPPGIGIPRIAGIGPHQTIVSAALVAKTNAETPPKARWEVRSEATPVSMPWPIRGSRLLAREVMCVMMLSPFTACRFPGRPNTRPSDGTTARWDVHRYG